MEDQRLIAFKRLLDIMDQIREGCPWDSTQTIDSLRHLSIEEVYELSDAIINHNMNDIRKELGDIMLHIVFYSKIASEQNIFDITDVLNGICEKLVTRHPHIFGDSKVENAKEVSENWERIKLNKEGTRSVLAGVPTQLPPLLKAYRMMDKTSGVGFEWENGIDSWEKVEEELQELKDEVAIENNHERIESEFGDVLFALVNYARYIGVNPDTALERCNKKYKTRFTYIEEQAKRNGTRIQDLSLDEMIKLWKEAKTLE